MPYSLQIQTSGPLEKREVPLLKGDGPIFVKFGPYDFLLVSLLLTWEF